MTPILVNWPWLIHRQVPQPSRCLTSGFRRENWYIYRSCSDANYWIFWINIGNLRVVYSRWTCHTLIAGLPPKRLKAYRIPEQYKIEVSRQITELLRWKFIEPSESPMTSPIVRVLKQPDNSGYCGLRLAIDYRNVNHCSFPSVAPIADIS